MKRCNCYSAIDGKGQESIAAKAPKWSSKEWISIDVCIWPFVKELWSHDIQTGGSCCGHGKEKASVVLVDFKDINKAIMIAMQGEFEVKIFAWNKGQIDVYFGADEAIQESL